MNFLEEPVAFSHVRLSNNRSVMPLDARGRTRATMKQAASVTLLVRKDWATL